MPRVKKETKKSLIDEDQNELMAPEKSTIITDRGSKLRWLPWILIVLVVAAAGSFVYYQQLQAKALKKQIEEIKQNPQKVAEDETRALLEKVGQLIELPNENPTIATVTDPSSLKDQPFFASAKLDDKVLIYSVAKKAILYRPSSNKIIEVAPVTLGSNTNTTSSSPAVNNSKNTNTTNTKTSTQKK